MTLVIIEKCFLDSLFSWTTRLRTIFRATKQHALNLAKFVSLYKTLLLIQKKVNGGKPRSSDTFIAGLIGGYIVFGDRNAINEQVNKRPICLFIGHCVQSLTCFNCSQIVLYVCSRVVASFIPRASSPYAMSSTANSAVRPIPPDARQFSIFAALCWGAVMWLFSERGETIQPGMFNSMTYLYRDSDHWSNLRTLFWHNK